MKQIPSSHNNAQWESSLLGELSYIKKHLRYKPKRKTYTPVIFWGCVLLSIGILSTILLITNAEHKVNYAFLFISLTSFIIYPTIIIKYLSSLTFTSISTDFYVQQNQRLLEQFLKSEHFMVYKHPDAPEIFQIQSRNISLNNDENREIIIFIVDDMRILINSHFTNGGWTIPPGRRHHRQMGKKLKEWIAQNAPVSSSLTRQKF